MGTDSGEAVSDQDMNEDPSEIDKTERLEKVRVSAAKCVRCGQPVQARFRPFCSQRCQEADLGAWVTESYRVETDDGGPAGSSDETPGGA